MQREKAREFFSDYLENTLEPGLRQQFEQALASDPLLMHEYREFVAVVQVLEASREEEIEVPLHISSHITSALEGVKEPHRSKVFQLFDIRRNWVPVAATLALVAAIAAIVVKGNGRTATAEVFPVPAVAKSDITWQGGSALVDFHVTNGKQLTVREGIGGEVRDVTEFNNEHARRNITNTYQEPLVLDLNADGQLQRILVLPGKGELKAQQGEGGLGDIAKALSACYGIALEIVPSASSSTYKWDFAPGDPMSNQDSLATQGLALQKNANGFYLVSSAK